MSITENLVSVWCGNFDCEDELLSYLEMDYSSDKDSYHSQFMQEMAIDWYDEDFAECGFYDNINHDDIGTMIAEHSYATSFVDELVRDFMSYMPCNSLLLIYDFDGRAYRNPQAKLQLVGVYVYKK